MNNNEIENWFESYFRKLEDHYEYMDNKRWALKSDKEQVRIYEEKRERGCCGFYDKSVRCPIDGNIYLVGFNYGH